MTNLFKTQPALVTTLIGAVFSLVIAFGLNLSQEQQGAITAVLFAIAGVVTRSQVTPTSQLPPTD